MILTHYIVVRRDLPVPVALAQVAHAAGESFYAFPSSSVKERRSSARTSEVAGSSPASGSNFDPSHTVVVVLGARNQGKLQRLEMQLLNAGVPHVAVREPDAPYFGELTAIGLVPGLKSALASRVNEFQMYPDPAVPPAEVDDDASVSGAARGDGSGAAGAGRGAGQR